MLTIKTILPVFLLVNISFLIKYFLLVLVVSRICNPYNFFLSLFGKLVYAIRLLLGGYPRSYKNSRFRSQWEGKSIFFLYILSCRSWNNIKDSVLFLFVCCLHCILLSLYVYLFRCCRIGEQTFLFCLKYYLYHLHRLRWTSLYCLVIGRKCFLW